MSRVISASALFVTSRSARLLLVLGAASALLAGGGCVRRGPLCGDGMCAPTEVGFCAADCSGQCGNGVCETAEGETAANCPGDCGGGPVCGNGVCETADGETAATCPGDCGASCGNGICDAGETTTSCPGDCTGPVCGNGFCEAGESAATCPGDCSGGGPVCGNGVCEVGESNTSCPGDCPPGAMCGNGTVEMGEDCDPPNGINCDSTCQSFTMTGPANPGAACTTDSGCSSGTSGLPVACLTETAYGWPGGYCLTYDCTINATTGTDDCPGASTCRGFGDGMGGTVYYCTPDCTPTPTGIGSCRTTTTTTDAYTCLPDIVDPASGGCWIGCQNDTGCNPCDMAAGTCFNDPSTSCAADADCLVSPFAYACNTTVNACHPDHTAGTSSIGDPCTDDLDCPQYAYCLTDATIYPGGYCTVFYCSSYSGIPAFNCPAGSVCPAASGWLMSSLQLCAPSCTSNPASPSTPCNTLRGDSLDYECIELDPTITAVGDLFDGTPTAGFCFQCEGLFATGCP
jgi:hypothetical protein